MADPVGLLLAYTTKVCKSQGNFTLHNLLKLHVFPVPEFSSFSLVFIHSARKFIESLLTLVVKEESLPCSYPRVSHLVECSPSVVAPC
jgi:hypothetical protein